MSSSNYLTTSPLQITQATVANAPTAQPTFDSWTLLDTTAITMKVNKGGTWDGFLVVGKIGGYHTGSPVPGTDYSVGNIIGDGTVLFKGAGAGAGGTLYNLAMTALISGSRYYFKVYTYNGSGIAVNYNTTSPLQVNDYTLSTEPAAQPTKDTVVEPDGIAGITDTTITLRIVPSGTSPVANKFIVVRKTGGYHTGAPADGTTYSIGTAIGDGTVCFYGAGTDAGGGKKDLVITGLTVNTTYYFTVYAVREDV